MKRILLICFISAVFVYGFFLGERGFTLESGQARIVAKPRVGTKAVQENVSSDVAIMPAKYPLPDSQWYASERDRYTALLKKDRYDVIVVPFQVQGFALDRMTRSYMAVHLASEIRRRSNNTVADPHIVARAIGDGRRRVETSDVYELAKAVGADVVIWGHTGHSSGAHVSFTLQVQKASGAPVNETTPITVFYLPMLRLPAETHPIDTYATAVEDVLPQLPLDFRDAVTSTREADSGIPALARSPLGMTGDGRNAVQSIYDFHLLAMLTPEYADRVRERFVEKSMLALQGLNDQTAEYRLLKARTLMLFGLRPAALSALGKPGTTEERYFYEFLNGNLPAASELAGQIRPVQKRFIAELEVAAMAAHYGVYTPVQIAATMDALGLSGRDWQLLANRALSDRDVWIQFDNLELKKLVNLWFPIEGPTIESLVNGAMTVGDMDKVRSLTDFSVHNHVGSLLTHDSKSFCCVYDPTRPSNLDLLDLVSAMAIGNLARRMELLAVYQGLPERAIAESDRLDAVYVGHPLLTLRRAQGEFYSVDKVEGVAKKKLLELAYRHALDAYYWSRGQTHVAAKAIETMNYIDISFYGLLNNPYSTDYPYRPYYVKLDDAGRDWDIHNALVALENSAFIVDPVRQLKEAFRNDPKGENNRLDSVLQSIEARFAGNMEIALIKTEAAYRKGDRVAAEKGYRAIVAGKPKQWAPYSALAVLLFEDGRAVDAAKTALSFPGFAPDSGENVVGLSNYAYDIGSRFFWAGYFGEALSFYRISADLKTGSHASITSQLRLDLLDTKLVDALQGSYQRAVRYGVPHAYRDYLAILYAMGFSEDAWNGFNALVQEMREPQPWEAALVGHRVSETSETDLIAWAQQDMLKHKGTFGNYAAAYLLRASVTDRLPSDAVIKAVSEIDQPVWRAYGGTIRKSVPSPGRQSAPVAVGPAKEDLSVSTPAGPIPSDTAMDEVISELVYFAKGYKALRDGDYGAALQAFDDASRLYDVSPGAMYSYLLPYMAFAASTKGDTSRIRSVINRIEPSVKDFDYLLAQAVLSGLAGETDEAVRLLGEARHHRPPTESRPIFTEYQYAEIAEWLYERTGESEFRRIALEWAQICQKTKPWHGWAYAMEAKLSNDSTAQRRAIAMAAYLDPLSERLRSLPKPMIKKAIKEFERENPFRQDPRLIEQQVLRQRGVQQHAETS